MKKYLLTALVVFACVVNAADDTPVTINKNYTGGVGRPNGTVAGQLYYYQKGDVIYAAKWGGLGSPIDSSNNQMTYYERVDAYGNNISGWKYENGTLTFTSDYVWTDFASRQAVKTNIPMGDIVEFGYYKINVDGQPTETKAMMTVDGENITKNSVIFQKDDKIGFYAKIEEVKQTTNIDHYEHKVGDKTYISDKQKSYVDENGKKYNHNGTPVYETVVTGIKTLTTTENVVEGATSTINNVDTNSRGLVDQYFCLFQNKIDGSNHYEYYLSGIVSSSEGQSYDDFINKVIDANTGEDGNPTTTITDSNGNTVNTPSGQPLPGLLVTLAIGGTVLAGVSKKRKQTRA